jgi:hypothetical protein
MSSNFVNGKIGDLCGKLATLDFNNTEIIDTLMTKNKRQFLRKSLNNIVNSNISKGEERETHQNPKEDNYIYNKSSK